MNPVQFFEYGKSRVSAIQPNTFIGGVAATIPTKEDLATKLGISSSNISSFNIVGSDIEATIISNYAIPASCFEGNTAITYYKTIEGKAISMGIYAFKDTVNMEFAEFSGQISLNNTAFGGSSANIIVKDTLVIANGAFLSNNSTIVYIPNATNIGGNVTKDNVFSGHFFRKKIYCHPSLATSNAGAEEGDVAYARSLGSIIRYVDNFTAPNPITDLSIGTVYATAIQVNFTAPTGSFNAIEYYECYANGVYKNTIEGSGDFITGLTPGANYSIEVKPVDILYNKSSSNTVTQITSIGNILDYPINERLISYYKMEGNVLDSWGTNHGTATAITYESGTVGQQAIFNNSFITVEDSNNLTFTDGAKDFPFSISFLINFTSKTTSYFFGRDSSGTAREWLVGITPSGLTGYLFNPDNSGRISAYIPTAEIPTGTNLFFTLTYNGNNKLSGLKMYINSTEKTLTNASSGSYTGQGNTASKLYIGKSQFIAGNLNAKMDEIAIWNTALTPAEISDINAKLNLGQSLI